MPDTRSIRLSLHATRSASARGITNEEIEHVRAAGARYLQDDGAVVCLLETEPGRYLFVVENPREQLVITVSDRRLPRHQIQRFILRYGWRRLEQR